MKKTAPMASILHYLIRLPLPPANKHLIEAYAAELRLMSERYMAGAMSKEGYLLFTKEIEGRILASGVALVEVVRIAQ